MSYSFGWWDYFEGERPAMVNRFSGERIAKGGPLDAENKQAAMKAHPDTTEGAWTRFDYEHEEFNFPLAVLWQPEAGKVIVDYNLSAKIWRRESNSDVEWPPYGGWVRVDDMVADAFWCWPGMLSALLERKLASDKYPGIGSFGGWLGTAWRTVAAPVEKPGNFNLHLDDQYNSLDKAPPRLDVFADDAPAKVLREYTDVAQRKRTLSIPVTADPPPAWRFFLEQLEALRLALASKSGGRKFVEPMVPRLRSGLIPCTISTDKKRLFHPVQPEDSGYQFYYRSETIGASVQMREEAGTKKFGFSHLLNEAQPELGQSQPSNPVMDVEHANGLRRDIEAALAVWSGTTEKPTEWPQLSNFCPDKEFEQSSRVTAEVGALGGRRCLGRHRIIELENI